MPCTFTSIKMQERQRNEDLARVKKAEEERKREEIVRKKKALLAALVTVGFTVESSVDVDGSEFIVAADNKQGGRT